jgi:AraC-like DNA-binding protein
MTPARSVRVVPIHEVLPMPATDPRRPAAVATILHPSERARVDAAGNGAYHALHRQTVDEVAVDLRAKRVRAVLLSVTCCGPLECTHIARLVREFPLRDALSEEQCDDIIRLALGALSLDLMGVPDDCWRFFDALFRTPSSCLTVRTLAEGLGVLPSTLMSRFFRARLPAPKRYLAYARLTHAARMFENPGLSIANVSNQLEYSSPQSFCRHVRTLIGVSALEFRARYDGEGMLHRFREELVLPFVEKLRRFYPLSTGTRWSGVLRALS